MENSVNTNDTASPSTTGSQANLLDGLSVLGLVVGAGASVAMNNVAAGVVPVALGVGLHIVNRRQLATEMAQKQEAAIASVIQQVTQHQTALTEYLQKFQGEMTTQLQQQSQTQEANHQSLVQSLAEQAEAFKQQLAALQGETTQTQTAMKADHQSLTEVVGVLRSMVNHSHRIEANPEQAEAYYQRGLNHQSLGDREEALRDYSEAIRRNEALAGAYYQRGIIHAELSNRKQAVEDLRQAAKLYFEQGDLDNYHRARDLGKEFYDAQNPLLADDVPAVTPESIAVTGEGDEDNSHEPLLKQESGVTAGNLFD